MGGFFIGVLVGVVVGVFMMCIVAMTPDDYDEDRHR